MMRSNGQSVERGMPIPGKLNIKRAEHPIEPLFESQWR
jgi:hypothetical protein